MWAIIHPIPTEGRKRVLFTLMYRSRYNQYSGKPQTSISHTQKQTELGKDLRLAERQGNNFHPCLMFRLGKSFHFRSFSLISASKMEDGEWALAQQSLGHRSKENSSCRGEQRVTGIWFPFKFSEPLVVFLNLPFLKFELLRCFGDVWASRCFCWSGFLSLIHCHITP